MKKFKDFLIDKGISESDFATKSPEEMAQLYNEYNQACLKTISDDVANKANKDDIPNIDEAIKDLVSKEVFTKLEDSLKAQGLELTKLKEKGVGATIKTIDAVLLENKEQIEKSVEKGHEASFTVNKTNFLRAGVTDSTQALRLDSIGQLAHRRFVLRDLFNIIPVGSGSNGVVRYSDWDQASITRAAAMIAEGGTFPESEAVFAEFTLDLKKIGDTIPISEEVLFDIPRFARELDNFLSVNVALIEDDQLYDGDGTGNNLSGVFTTAEEYVASASGISDASIYDLIVKMSEDMTSGKRSKYQPNFALMNIVDINKMKLKKDGNENYIMPPFVTNGGQTVDGLTIIQSAAVTADTMMIGDGRYGSIYEVEGYNVTTGHSGTQFIEDLVTLKAKKREGLLIRVADRGAFKKETGIAAALVTLAT